MKNTTAKREKFYTADGVVDRWIVPLWALEHEQD